MGLLQPAVVRRAGRPKVARSLAFTARRMGIQRGPSRTDPPGTLARLFAVVNTVGIFLFGKVCSRGSCIFVGNQLPAVSTPEAPAVAAQQGAERG